MRKTMLFLIVFGLAGSLWAAHPFVGTWKLNVAKSKPAPGQQATIKELTVVVSELDNDLEVSFTGTGADGSPISFKYTIPKQGGVLQSAQEPTQPPTEGTFVVITVVAPDDMYGTSIQNGKQVEMTHTFVGKDGKTMNRTIKGMDDQGKPFEAFEVYDRQ